VVLSIVGLLTGALAVGADVIGIGGLPGLGLKQVQLAISGMLVAISGLLSGAGRVSRATRRSAMAVERALANPVALWSVVGVLCLASLLTLLVVTRDGMVMSPDSYEYEAAARSLIRGAGYRRADERPFVHWAPLFPTALGAIGLSGLEPVEAARVLNAGLFGMVVVLTSCLLAWGSAPRSVVVIAAVITMVSPVLWLVSTRVWSEPLFVVLQLATLLALLEYMERPSKRRFVALTALTASALLTRYAAVTVLASNVLALLLAQWSQRNKRLGVALGHGAASSVPLALWLARNYLLTRTLTGTRGLSMEPFQVHVVQAGRVGSLWLICSGSLGLLTIALKLQSPPVPTVLRSRSRWLVTAASCFIVTYVAVLIASVSVFLRDDVNDRLLSPVRMPLAILAVAIGVTVSQCLGARARGEPSSGGAIPQAGEVRVDRQCEVPSVCPADSDGSG
jgi:hypothetical protein